MELLTPEEVAEELKLSAFTVRKLLRQGVLPGIPIGNGKVWRVDRVDLDRYLAVQRTKAKPKRGPKSKTPTAEPPQLPGA